MEQFTTPKITTNTLDKGVRGFVDHYRYELLASLLLVALLGGIALAVVITNRPREDVVVVEGGAEEEPTLIMVDVGGAVASPGTYELNYGARVKEVIDAAGGLKPEADQSWIQEVLNRAEVLQDGQKIFIPLARPMEEQGVVIPTSTGLAVQGVTRGQRINLNVASLEELMQLPGIGEKYAQNIIDARPFASIEELLDVAGIGPKRYDQIKDLVNIY